MSNRNLRVAPFVRAVEGLSQEDLIWAHGYLSGKLGSSAGDRLSWMDDNPAGEGEVQAKTTRFTLAYGTETGNSKRLAIHLATKAKAAGFQVKLVAIDQYRLENLSNETHFFLVISTQGDGEPPASALRFFTHIQRSDLSLSAMGFAVLGLGDSAYPQFCQAADDADKYLTQRGAQRLLPLVKCDVSYDSEAEQWLADIIAHLKSGSDGMVAAKTQPGTQLSDQAGNQKIRYAGEVVANVNLNDEPSLKQTHHIEIRCDDIDYLPGDAAGFVPHNTDEMVDRVLAQLAIQGDEITSFRGTNGSLRDLLREKVNLRFLPDRVVRKYAELTSQSIAAQRMDFDSLLQLHPPGRIEPTDLLAIMDPISPRLYSISSSPASHPGELHLTVANHTYVRQDGTQGNGFCSTFLRQLAEHSVVEFSIHRNHAFRLPAPDRDIIMIGPGTGIAPFRSFLFERDSTGATGRNWLFFGEQHFVTDFLYQTEIQDFLQTGVLHRLDVAFSRDQKEKLYVQHRLQEKGAELFDWIDAGATVFVCGAKSPMSLDVETALLQVIERHGNMTGEQATGYLHRLIEQNRYLKDVY